MEAVRRCGIFEREVRVEWTMLVRRNFSCILESESHAASFSLENLAMVDIDSEDQGIGREVFGILEDYHLFGGVFMWGKIFASD